jgi:aryl-alcohol dehydrogenase-like predicted oxidoreductase
MTWSPLAGGWLSGRYGRKGFAPTSRRAQSAPFDLTLADNRRKLTAVQALTLLADEIGVTLIEMALAWVMNHPALTSAIVGPRTMDHLDSQLTATAVTLDASALDRIDQIVPPGRTVSALDDGFLNPALEARMRRR